MNKIYLFTAAFAVMASLSGCSDTELASIDTAQKRPQSASIPLVARWDQEQRLLIIVKI